MCAKDGLCRWECVRAPGRMGKGSGIALNMATSSDDGVRGADGVDGKRCEEGMGRSVRDGEGSKEGLDGA